MVLRMPHICKHVLNGGYFFSGIFFLFLALIGCGEKVSSEDQVRQFVVTGKAAAELRDVLAISDLISEQYSDEDNRDRRKLIGMVTGYFLRYKNIHLFTHIRHIHFPVANQAELQLYVAMAGSPMVGVEAVFNLRADVFRFDLILVREGDEWLLKNAQWRRASAEDFVDQ